MRDDLIILLNNQHKLHLNMKKSIPNLKPQNKRDEDLNNFYKLHYPQKKDLVQPNSRFRAKSVISMTQKENPEIGIKHSPQKSRLQDHHNLSQPQQLLRKQKVEHQKYQPFSFKRALSGEKERGHIVDYFQKCGRGNLGSLDDLAKQNMGIRNAIQKCKDEKMKVSKVLGSQRQTESTKMDYLQLKKQEIQDQRAGQVKQMYDEFFKKEYERLYGGQAWSQFEGRMQELIGVMHSQLFAN